MIMQKLVKHFGDHTNPVNSFQVHCNIVCVTHKLTGIQFQVIHASKQQALTFVLPFAVQYLQESHCTCKFVYFASSVACNGKAPSPGSHLHWSE